jgi:hypothetical protein
MAQKLIALYILGLHLEPRESIHNDKHQSVVIAQIPRENSTPTSISRAIHC